MGIFSEFFKFKNGNSIQKLISNLQEWEQKHFCNNYYGNALRYGTYQADNGEKISLMEIKVPFIQDSQSDTVLGKLKGAIDFLNRKNLPDFISEYRTGISNEINKYNANCVKLKNLSSTLQEDPLFEEIEHIFCERLKILYNELLFCKFDKLNDTAYFKKIYERLIKLHEDVKNLNNDFTDYMYALTNTEYENTNYDIERIRISVEAMSEVAGKFADESLGVK